jgi:pyruvate dehydrogenase E2 component (dihydrolipoamide acetyltransferase)
VITRVALPKVDANIEEIAITAWLKKEGEFVRKGEPLVEMTTEKATFEFEAPRSGTLRRVLAEEKSVLPIGYVIALIGDADGELPDVAAANRRLLERYRKSGLAARGTATKPAVGAMAGPMPPVVGNDVMRATPAARRLAREKGIDLAVVKLAMKVDVINESVVHKFLEQRLP